MSPSPSDPILSRLREEADQWRPEVSAATRLRLRQQLPARPVSTWPTRALAAAAVVLIAFAATWALATGPEQNPPSPAADVVATESPDREIDQRRRLQRLVASVRSAVDEPLERELSCLTRDAQAIGQFVSDRVPGPLRGLLPFSWFD